MWYPSSGARPAGSENGSAAISGLTLFLAENELHWGCGRVLQPPRPFPSCPHPGTTAPAVAPDTGICRRGRAPTQAPPVRVRSAAQQLAGLHRVPRPGTYPGGNAGGAKPALPRPLWAHKKWRCGSPMLIPVLLVCCSWPLTASLPRLACGENLPHRWPERKTAGSWGGIDTRLPWYTSGFK